MRIGIIGLRPRQVSDIQSRAFDIDLDFLTVKDADPAKVERFSRDKSRVVVMTGHVMRDAASMVPSEKRQFINGSVSALSRYLEEVVEEMKKSGYSGKQVEPWYSDVPYLPGGAVVEVEDWGPVGDTETPKVVVEVNPVQITVGEKMVQEEKKEAPVKIASQLPEGRRSQYLLPKSDILINYPNSGGVQNYQILLAAIPGDVVRFARPEGLSLASWRKRIEMTRHNYWKKHGLLLEAHFFNEYVDVQVMRIEEDVVPKNTLNLTIARDTSKDNPSRDMGKTEVFAVESEGVPATQGPAPRPTTPTLMDVATGDVLKTLAVSGSLPKAPSGPPPLPKHLREARQDRFKALLQVEADGDIRRMAQLCRKTSSQIERWLETGDISTFHALSLEQMFKLQDGWMDAKTPLGKRFMEETEEAEAVATEDQEEGIRRANLDSIRKENLKLIIEVVFFDDLAKFAQEIKRSAVDLWEWMNCAEVPDAEVRNIEQVYGLAEFELDSLLEEKEVPAKPVWPIMRGSERGPVEPTPIAPAPEVVEEVEAVVEEEAVPATKTTKARKEAKLWRDVLVAAVRYGQEVDVAIDDADEALEAYRERFGA